jgi:hypothetical protein
MRIPCCSSTDFGWINSKQSVHLPAKSKWTAKLCSINCYAEKPLIDLVDLFKSQHNKPGATVCRKSLVDLQKLLAAADRERYASLAIG